MSPQGHQKTQVIVVAAGEGTRLKSVVPKPFVCLGGRPVLAYSLDVFEQCSLVEGVVVVVHADRQETCQALTHDQGWRKISCVVAGGRTRAESVANGLKALDADTQFVAIHDGARPLVSLGIVEEAIRVCYHEKAVIVAVPVKPTIKRVNLKDLTVVETIDRRDLWEIQTPQVFSRELIVRAHQGANSASATDDATLVERLGQQVKIVTGDYRNIKITTPEDLLIAESLLRAGVNG